MHEFSRIFEKTNSIIGWFLGAPFILYNTARITAIIEKYNDKRLKGEYPNLPHINDVDFSLLNQEVFHLKCTKLSIILSI